MRRLFLYILAVAIIGFAYSKTGGTGVLNKPASVQDDTVATAPPSVVAVQNPVTPLPSDSLSNRSDSTSLDSTATDITFRDSIPADSTKRRFSKIDRNKVDLENSVTFNAKDSLVMLGNNDAYLYGSSEVEYTEFKIKSGEIRMELDSSTVYATGVVDSVGELKDTPVFSDKSGEYESKQMKYNFKTQRGYITDIITEQGEGYLTGGTSKKMDDGSFFVKDGRYTTCDDHEHPHFYFQITKAKMRPQKDVVTGPGYMVLAGVPLLLLCRSAISPSPRIIQAV